MNTSEKGWIKLWRHLVTNPVWLQSSPQCCKVFITILLLANYTTSYWEYNGQQYKCGPGQLVTSIDSLVKACGVGTTREGVRSAITRLTKLGVITNVSTHSGRLITVVNWAKYQGYSSGDPIADANVGTIGSNIVTPKSPHSYPIATPPIKESNNINNTNNSKKNNNTLDQGTEAEPKVEDDSNWWHDYLATTDAQEDSI